MRSNRITPNKIARNIYKNFTRTDCVASNDKYQNIKTIQEMSLIRTFKMPYTTVRIIIQESVIYFTKPETSFNLSAIEIKFLIRSSWATYF